MPFCNRREGGIGVSRTLLLAPAVNSNVKCYSTCYSFFRIQLSLGFYTSKREVDFRKQFIDTRDQADQIFITFLCSRTVYTAELLFIIHHSEILLYAQICLIIRSNKSYKHTLLRNLKCSDSDSSMMKCRQMSIKSKVQIT